MPITKYYVVMKHPQYLCAHSLLKRLLDINEFRAFTETCVAITILSKYWFDCISNSIL